MEFREIDPAFFAGQLAVFVRDEPKAFAYDTGMSVSAIYYYLRGRIPETQILFRIAQYTGRPMEWFLDPEFAKRYDAGQQKAA